MGMLSRLAPLLPALALMSGLAQAAPETTSFTVSGQVLTPRSYDAAGLQALPQTTQSVTYQAGSGTVSDSFTGPLLWDVLQGSGGMIVDQTTHNGVLRNYVVVTGSDGYKAVISAGEIAPSFGNRSDLVATSATSGSLPSPDGFARVVATGDVHGGRFVSNVASIAVGTAPLQAGTGGGTSSSMVVQGAVATAQTFGVAELQALAAHTTTVSYLSGSNSVTHTYTGALLWDVLMQAGIITDASIKNDILRKMVIATGSDGYQVVFSLGELSPYFGNSQVLVAYTDENGALTTDGFARLVVPGDVKGGRYVSNLVSLTVFDATEVPEPASLALLLAGIAGLAAVRGRRLEPV